MAYLFLPAGTCPNGTSTQTRQTSEVELVEVPVSKWLEQA